MRRHFITCKCLASCQKISLDFAFIDDPCLTKLYSDGCKMLILALYLSDSTCDSKQDSLPFYHFCLSVCLQHRFIDFCFFSGLLFNITLKLYSCLSCSRLSQWELLQDVFCILVTYPHQLYLFLSTSSLFGITRCFRFILHLPCHSSGIMHFSKNSQFLLLGIGSRNQNLGVRYHVVIGIILY